MRLPCQILRIRFYIDSVYFKTLENSTSDDPDKISEKYLQVYKQAAGKYALNFTLTQA